MPLYEYLCGRCERRFERLVRSSDAAVDCPECGSRDTRRLFSVFGINLGAPPETSPGALCNCGAGGCAICSARIR
ncbi:MAG: FmdB family zinc ribbon protein [Planctomycetota bacterium]